MPYQPSIYLQLEPLSASVVHYYLKPGHTQALGLQDHIQLLKALLQQKRSHDNFNYTQLPRHYTSTLQLPVTERFLTRYGHRLSVAAMRHYNQYLKAHYWHMQYYHIQHLRHQTTTHQAIQLTLKHFNIPDTAYTTEAAYAAYYRHRKRLNKG